MRKSTEARIKHRQTTREMLRCAVAGALTGIVLTVGIATAKLTLTPKPATPSMQAALQKHPYCYVEGCFRQRRTADDWCVGHAVMGKVDRAVRDSVMYGIRQQHLRHGVVGASGYAFRYGPRLHSVDADSR